MSIAPASTASAAGGTFAVAISTPASPVLAGESVVYNVAYSCSGTLGDTCETPRLDVRTACAPVMAQNCVVTYNTTAHPDVTGGSAPYWNLRTLAGGESGVLAVTVITRNGTTPDGTVLTVTAQGSAEGVLTPVVTAGPVTINAQPRLVADKQVAPTSISVGGTATYTVRYSASSVGPGANISTGTIAPDPATMRVVDTLPTGAVFVSATAGGQYDADSHTVTWQPAPLSTASYRDTVAVTVQFPTAAFTAGEEVTNNAVVSGVPYHGSEADRLSVPVARTHSLDEPVYGRLLTKSVSSSIGTSALGQFNGPATRGDRAQWAVAVQNRSNAPVDMQLLDTLQPGVEAVYIWLMGTSVVVHYDDGTSDTIVSSNPASSLRYDLDPAKRAVAFEATRLATAPNQYLQLSVVGPVGVGTDQTLVQNCADTIGTVAGTEVWNTVGVAGQQACTGMVILDTRPIPGVTITTPLTPAAAVGQEITWTIGTRNQMFATGDAVTDGLGTMTQPFASVSLLPGHTYVPGSLSCEVDAACTVTVTMVGAVQTLAITWPDRVIPPATATGAQFTDTFRTLVGPDAAAQLRAEVVFGDLDKPFVMANPCCSYPTRAGHVADTADVNANQVANEYLASSSGVRGVLVAGTLAATKRVQGDLDAAIVTAPGIGRSLAGGTAEYRVTLTNTSTQPATDIVVYDVLPHPGDTGIIGSQTSVARGSQFRVTLAGAPTTSVGTPEIAYSTSTNPCRPEVGVAAGCDDAWTTTAPGTAEAWAEVNAIRVRLVGTTLTTSQSVTLTLPVDVPDEAVPGELAYNSVAYAAEVGGAALSAEPIRIGVQVHDAELSITALVQTLFDADDADSAPPVETGTPVKWTFVVANSGTLPLTGVVVTVPGIDPADIDCGDGTNVIAALDVGETVECVALGTAVSGLESIVATVAADSEAGEVVDTDPAAYVGITPAIAIEKRTQGVDADTEAEAPSVDVGASVRWTYTVTNSGDVVLYDVTVTDSVETGIDCGNGTNVVAELAVGESAVCELTGVATAGLYRNVGIVTARDTVVVDIDGDEYPLGVDADDPSHYVGQVVTAPATTSPTAPTTPTVPSTPTAPSTPTVPSTPTAPSTPTTPGTTIVLDEVNPPGPPTPGPVDPGVLPVTGGSNVATMLLAAGVLLAGGAFIAVVTRRRRPQPGR